MMTELEIEANITVYTFKGGVEQRRNAFPMSALNLQLQGIGTQFAKLAEYINNEAFTPLQKFGQAMRKAAQ